MQREIRTKLPSQESLVPYEDDSKVQQTNKSPRRRERNMPMEEGGQRKKHRNKFSTTFGKEPVKVTKVNGSQIVFQDKDGKIHCRNSAHVKKIPKPINPIPIHDEIDDQQNTANSPVDPEPQQQTPTS